METLKKIPWWAWAALAAVAFYFWRSRAATMQATTPATVPANTGIMPPPGLPASSPAGGIDQIGGLLGSNAPSRDWLPRVNWPGVTPPIYGNPGGPVGSPKQLPDPSLQ